MGYAFSNSKNTRRSVLLGLIVGAHIAVAAVVLAAKAVAPQLLEMPLVVDLLPPPPREIPETQAKPLPMAKPQPVLKATSPRTPQPALESTTSTLSAPQAPVAPTPDPKPVPAVPAAEPATSARFDADYLKNPAPAYPPASRRMGEEGKVTLHVQVSPQGGALQVAVRTSSGSPRLDEAAAQTVRTWKFIPAKRGDTSVESWVLVPIIFKLEH